MLAPIVPFLKNLAPQNSSLSLNFALTSDIPLGGGLSSSASLMVCITKFLETVTHTELDGPARALQAKLAENGPFVNSPCGIMDQFIISTAVENHLCLIKCGGEVGGRIVEMVSFGGGGEGAPVLMVCDCGVRHSIAGGEYPVRVLQCAEAKRHVCNDEKELSDATMEELQAAVKGSEELWVKRARHVVSENMRVAECVDALKRGEWETVGRLMNASHESLRTDFEVSCEELDVLCEISRGCEGVYGCRMTGGGFGGCTISLVESGKVEQVMAKVKEDYKTRCGVDAVPFIVHRPGGGVMNC